MSRMRRPTPRGAVARLLAASALAIGLAAPATASAGTFDSLSGWWPMYEGSGQVVHDLSGHGNTGTLGSTPGVDDNDPTWIKGFLFGSALRFDGNDLVRIADKPSLDTPKVTVSAWVRATGALGKWRYVVGKGARGCDAAGYGLYSGENGGLRFYFQDPDDIGLLHGSGIVAPEAIWNGKWHHVAGTYDGTVARLYVDGKLVPNDGPPTFASGGVPQTGTDVGIGDYLGTCDLFYTGDIDEVAIFDQALPIDRIWSAVSSFFAKPLR
jgi:hypothetical protein